MGAWARQVGHQSAWKSTTTGWPAASIRWRVAASYGCSPAIAGAVIRIKAVVKNASKVFIETSNTVFCMSTAWALGPQAASLALLKETVLLDELLQSRRHGASGQT